jgi:hypothetical protein
LKLLWKRRYIFKIASLLSFYKIVHQFIPRSRL